MPDPNVPKVSGDEGIINISEAMPTLGGDARHVEIRKPDDKIASEQHGVNMDVDPQKGSSDAVRSIFFVLLSLFVDIANCVCN